MLKGFNRIISALIALCLIIGVLPSVALFDAKAADVQDLYFDFIKGNVGDTTAYATTITYDMNTAGSEDEINTSIVSEPWAVRSVSQGVDGGGYFTYNRRF